MAAMRERPFLDGGEAPRRFSEVRDERAALDSHARLRDRVRKDVRDLETRARKAVTADERNRLQCQAEELRCALDEQPRRR